MALYQNLDKQMADLNIEEEEYGEFMFDDDVEEQLNKYELCLVDRFLTEKNINTRVMVSKMADACKSTMGVSIKEIDPDYFFPVLS